MSKRAFALWSLPIPFIMYVCFSELTDPLPAEYSPIKWLLLGGFFVVAVVCMLGFMLVCDRLSRRWARFLGIPFLLFSFLLLSGYVVAHSTDYAMGYMRARGAEDLQQYGDTSGMYLNSPGNPDVWIHVEWAALPPILLMLGVCSVAAYKGFPSTNRKDAVA